MYTNMISLYKDQQSFILKGEKLMSLNLSKKIMLMVTAIVLVISAGLGFTALRISTNTIKCLVDDALIQLAEEGANHLDALINVNLSNITELANREGTKTMDWDVLYQSLYEDVDRLGFADIALVSPNRVARYVKSDELAIVRDVDYIEKAFQGEANLSDVIVNEATGETIIVYAAPIRKDDRIVGVLIGKKDSSNLNSIIGEMGYGDNGYAYLMNQDGIAMAHPDKSHVINRKSIFDDIETGGDYQDLAEAITELGIGNEGVIRYKLQGDNKYMGVAYLKTTGWMLGIGANEKDVLRDLNILINSIIIGAASYLLVGILAAALFARNVSRPIVDLSKIVERFSKYDLSIEENSSIYKHSNRKDEVGIISNALIEMDKNLVGLIKEISTAAQSVASSSEELTATSQQSAIAAEEVARAIDEIAKGAQEQSVDTEKGAFEVENLGKKINENINNISVLEEASGEIDLLKNEGLEIVKELVENTKASDNASIEIYGVIKDVDESASQIEKASQMIQTIAEQTNLLALNAAIEAARAGEAGRGFAVVSEEIRKLAEQSNNFTKEITNIIENLKLKTEKAVHTMEDIKDIVKSQSNSVTNTSIKFEGIADAIERIKQLINQIYVSSQEMEDAKNLIIEIMQNLSAISQENAASTEEASASVEEQTASMEEIANASEALASLADEMQQLVTKFKF